MPFIPHTADDIHEMLKTIGVSTIDDLFDEIPPHLRAKPCTSLADGLNEMELLAHAQSLADKNQSQHCFIGAGSYDHHIPAAVWDIASRGEFLTAYTPYQAEASQGTLQALYEFQSMIAELTAMDIANASLYDGASALAEAVFMSTRLKPAQDNARYQILVPQSLHPHYRDTLRTITNHRPIDLIPLPIDGTQGITALATLDAHSQNNVTALIIVQPNFFGCLEDVDALTNWAHAHDIITIACVNPIALGLLKPPGCWGEHGVDIACGEGQPLGAPMTSGGPYFGFFSTRFAHVRQMPGRLVGKTTDALGHDAFALTLQTREQHIRRNKATSNICTNQGLLVTAATIHMSLLGPQGLLDVATACHHNTRALIAALSQCPGVRCVFSAPYFHEALLQMPTPVQPLLAYLRQQGIAGGYAAEQDDTSLTNTLLVCATEKRSMEDIHHFQTALNHYLDQTAPSC